MVAAVICARGGSKRIYRKNVQMCAGMKLIEYPITEAKKCPFIDKIYVSTDDPEIAQIAESHNAIVINRPFQLITDFASSGAVSYHAYREISKQIDLDFIVNLWATSPCLRSASLISAYKKIKDFPTANVISAVYKLTKSSSLNNYYAMTPQNVLMTLFPATPQGVNVYTTNNLASVYYACGAFSIQRIGEIEKTVFADTKDIEENDNPVDVNNDYARAWAKVLLKRAEDMTNTGLGEEIDEYAGQDINYPEDLKMAEAILRFRGQGK
jgi:CMP-N-acetylneuraminic acid synthetase